LSELTLHLREMAIGALATGLREANLVELTWSQVDLERGPAQMYGDNAKGKADIHASLSDAAISVLCRQIGKHPERVFTYRGKPVAWAKTRARRKALKRVGPTDSAGTIYGTPGRAGTCRTALPCMTFRRWAAGSRKTSCSGTRTRAPRAREQRQACAGCREAARGHKPGTALGRERG
jgi:hypothetical protein